MIRQISLLWMLFILFATSGMAQAKRTTLSVEVLDFKGDMIYFDCAQTPLIREEFHANPGESYVYSFETDQIVNMFINGQTQVLLLPGDSLHAVLRYEEKPVQSAEFSGTPQAVLQNQLYWNVELLKRSMRYKSQLLSCAALDIKPKDRIADSRTLLEKVKMMIEVAGKDLPESAANYILSTTEAEAYTSMMEYPVMYADIRKLPVEKQEIGEYWSLMDGYVTRNDNASLRNPKYASMLMRYCFYENEKKAHAEGKTYQNPRTFEAMYQELASFYAGEQRDFLLYTIICNFIRNGKEIERVDSILKGYKSKYNKNKEYIQILDSLLQ